MTKYLVKNKEELQEIIKTNSKPLNSLDVSNITDMSFLFFDFSNVTYFDIDSWDTSNVTGMFEGCSSFSPNIYLYNSHICISMINKLF